MSWEAVCHYLPQLPAASQLIEEGVPRDCVELLSSCVQVGILKVKSCHFYSTICQIFILKTFFDVVMTAARWHINTSM